jgi:AbrB family looped-hinge helix DNA binding protein
MSTIVKLTAGGMITLPAKIRQKYKLAPGDSVAIIESPDGLLIVPVVPLEKLVNQEEASIAAEICRELVEEHRTEQKKGNSR